MAAVIYVAWPCVPLMRDIPCRQEFSFIMSKGKKKKNVCIYAFIYEETADFIDLLPKLLNNDIH